MKEKNRKTIMTAIISLILGFALMVLSAVLGSLFNGHPEIFVIVFAGTFIITVICTCTQIVLNKLESLKNDKDN